MVPAMKGRSIITGWKRTTLAAMLAYALALQGVLLALGGAMHVQAADLPETVLCVEANGGGPTHQPGPLDSADHALCCIVGCTAGIAISGPLPVAAALRMRFPAPLDLRPAAALPAPVIAPSLPPVGSRAPPRLA
jgi:hypothetical protein